MGIYKKDNRWYIDYYMPDGKRKREVVNVSGVDAAKITRRHAEKALSIRKAEIAEGKFNIVQTDKKLSFDKLMEEYLGWAKNNHKAPERDYAAKKPLDSYFKGHNVNKITLWHVEKYKSMRKSQGRKPETINKELGILRRMFNLACQGVLKYKVTKNPIRGIKLLRVSKYIPRDLKEEEFLRLCNAASSDFRPILLCAYLQGMRKGEIIKLKWNNIDLNARYIHITESKNNESRSIPISDNLFTVLVALEVNSKSEYVFTTPKGKPYISNTAWKTAWTNTLKKSGVGKCRFHDLRHTFVSNLIVGEKEDFETVMSLSGHKDLRMLKRYSHTREESKKAAISKLGNRLKPIGMDTYLDTKTKDEAKRAADVIALSPQH